MALEKVTIPDIGGAKNVDVIEVFIKVGDQVTKDMSLITLEGDKATMEVPAPLSGVVKEVLIKVGDKVSEGSVIAQVETDAETKPQKAAAQTASPPKQEKTAEKSSEKSSEKFEQPQTTAPAKTEAEEEEEDIHAGPGVRRLAREFGVDLNQISGSGPKNRIQKEDLQNYVKQKMKSGNEAGLAIAAAPSIDFSKFGQTEVKPLSKIKKISGASLHRNWVTIPHVTQFGEADVTEMEQFRVQQKTLIDGRETKLTPLVLVMKAVVAALKEYPIFNASLAANGEQLILKKYFHIGVAVDTPNGLVVPVIQNVDKKGLFALAAELAQISKKARETGLSIADMQGGCFTISSLGGIGGTAFTPIINAPEVAILGVSRTQTKPVYDEASGQWQPRLMLPLSLSYDHRVIDGADGARFLVYLTSRLSDIRTLLL